MTPEEIAAKEAEDKRLAEEAEAAKKKEEEDAKSKMTDQEKLDALVAAEVAAKLKDIKGKLDNSFAERDAALRKAEALEKKERDAELKALEDAGKFKEAFELKLAEEQAKYADLESKFKSLQDTNLEITRNTSLKDHLSGVDFRNSRALEMAFNQILPEIIKNDKGEWVHRSGMSIKDYVKGFAKDEANSFLIKPKESSGGGTTPAGTTPAGNGKTSLLGKTTAEILAMAEAGQLPKSK